MKKSVKIFDNSDHYVFKEISFPAVCPFCLENTHPTFLYGHFNDDDATMFTAVFQDSCGGIFLGVYFIDENTGETSLEGVAPNNYRATDLPSDVQKLSPDFKEVFGQSEHAESLGLNRICGMGYRKAAEFLIKDYCVHLNPDAKDKIFEESLSQTIKRIDDPRINNLSSKCRILGNDEVHTVIRYEENLEQFKSFLLSLVYIVQADLASEKALHHCEED